MTAAAELADLLPKHTVQVQDDVRGCGGEPLDAGLLIVASKERNRTRC